jgi:hypothetical protein
VKPMILSLCDYTGVMVEPWREAGFPCVIVDLQHTPGWDGFSTVLLSKVGRDVREFYLSPDEEVGAVFAFPPCTDLANSGARWFKGKGLRALSSAIELVAACVEIAEASSAPYMIENPVGQLSTYWRKPDHTFDPCDYGDPYTKKTCLWTGGGFVMPTKQRVEPTEGSKMHRLPPGPERANLRSATPPGFARAVFEANVGIVLGEQAAA